MLCYVDGGHAVCSVTLCSFGGGWSMAGEMLDLAILAQAALFPVAIVPFCFLSPQVGPCMDVPQRG
eukprot:3011613-Lingulodinium_polyedra.AAC.1